MTSLPSSSILHQNASATISLVDIPTSISLGQGCPVGTLLSSCPPREPFVIANEPKSAAAKAKAAGNTVDQARHAGLRQSIADGLREIREHHGPRDWCLPRGEMLETARAGKKRKATDAGDEADNGQDMHTGNHSKQPLLDVDHWRLGDQSTSFEQKELSPLLLDKRRKMVYDPRSIQGRVVSNASDRTTELQISMTPQEQETFYIPPKAAFLLADVRSSNLLGHTVASSATEPSCSPVPPIFDFILLDPPWPNASAKRSRAYEGPRSLQATEGLLRCLELSKYMASRGLVGIWVTNKPRFRDLVLRRSDTDDSSISVAADRGLFEEWNVELIEEWIWIKTTTRGEPVTDLDSAWRKPYEVLLLGRRKDGDSPDQPRPQVERRIIAGVPDLHSRKPSLKELIEPKLVDLKGHRALEIFARNLTAGWWAWGNEVLKFNWEGYWSKNRRGLDSQWGSGRA